jgi:ABC-type amino acid transport substrate-binding protein
MRIPKLALSLLAVALSTPALAAPKQALTVGTEGAYAPFTFTDEKGHLTGYDVEVVREIARRADLDVKFVPTPWDSMFLALESKKFDLVANQISKNPDREKKYQFSDDYLLSGAQIIVKGSRKDAPTSLGALAGKKVGEGTGSNYAKLVEDWNAKHGDQKIDLKYYDGALDSVLQDIVAGRLDATVNDRLTVGFNVRKRHLDLKPVGEPLDVVPSYFVVRKDAQGDALLKKVNAALAEMKKDGTLSKLSKQWFDADYTK